MAKAVYPGSFDPLTNGHLDIIRRAVRIFDHVTVLVAHNPRKTGLFSVEERMQLIRSSVGDDDQVSVDNFTGLLVDYAKEKECHVVLRGLRAVADFEYEGQMANMNRHLYSELETFFMMTSGDNFYVSSSLVREVAMLGGDIKDLVPPAAFKALHRKFNQ